MGAGIIAGNVAGITHIALALTPAEVSAATTVEQDFTVPGLKATDAVVVCPPGLQAGVGIIGARAKADNTLSVQFANTTDGAVTPTAGVHQIIVFRHEGVSGVNRVMT
jgi:hypothetical protein